MSYANLITALEALFALSCTVKRAQQFDDRQKIQSLHLRPQLMCLFVYLRVSVCSLALINIAGVDVSKSGLFGTARNSSGAAALALAA